MQPAPHAASSSLGREKGYRTLTYYLSNGLGDDFTNPSVAQMEEVLRDLDPDDEEHGAAWLSDGRGTSIEYTIDGNLSYGSIEAGHRHLPKVSREKVLELWVLFSNRELDAIEREPWQPGTRAPLSAEERARHARWVEESYRAEARQFYDTFGSERSDRSCRAPECTRGTVEYSVFCRPHHYENVRGHKSPFDD